MIVGAFLSLLFMLCGIGSTLPTRSHDWFAVITGKKVGDAIIVATAFFHYCRIRHLQSCRTHQWMLPRWYYCLLCATFWTIAMFLWWRMFCRRSMLPWYSWYRLLWWVSESLLFCCFAAQSFYHLIIAMHAATTCANAGLNQGCCWPSFLCRTSGGCYCDRLCHRYNDCCPDVGPLSSLPCNFKGM